MAAKFILKTLFIFSFLLSVNISFGQPTGGGPGGGAEPVPLGGLEILLVAGGALGIKKVVSGKKKKE